MATNQNVALPLGSIKREEAKGERERVSERICTAMQTYPNSIYNAPTQATGLHIIFQVFTFLSILKMHTFVT